MLVFSSLGAWESVKVLAFGSLGALLLVRFNDPVHE